MKKIFTYWLIGLMCLSGFVACDKDPVTTFDVSRSACVVSNVVMGSIPCVHHIKASDGSDSAIVVNVIGANYPMTIDHYAGRIFNVDSLPYGTDVSKVSFLTLSSSGTLAIRTLSQEGDTLFIPSDSTDFRTPRLVTVYAYDGISSRKYNMEVRVHQEDGDSFVWNRVCSGVESLRGASFSGALVHGDELMVYANKQGLPVLLRAAKTDVAGWTETALSAPIASPVVFEEQFYAVSNGEVVASADGVAWTAVAGAPADVLALAKVADFMVATAQGGFYKSVDGITWVLESVDERQFLPTSNVAMAALTAKSNSSYVDVYAVGDGNAEPVVWKHNVDLTGDAAYDWIYYPNSYKNPHPCPTLTMRQLFSYDGVLLQVGHNESGEMLFYCSHDEGRTWKKQHIPALTNVYGEGIAVIDAEHWVWVVTSEGMLLRGRFKRLGWATEQNVFK
ncbi:MAG: hypothetical protein II200_04340 [Bacteroidaceae bacterium]|nr:hypothetical protein [Bacteroidaceae bacterium]